MNIRTTQQIQDTIKASIQATDNAIALEDGQIIKDAVIDAPASEFRNVYVVLKYVELIQSVDGIEDLENDSTFKSDLATALGISATELTDATTWDIPVAITNDVDALIFRALDYLAANYDLTRTAATKARYIERFYRTNDNGGVPITIPLGTTVQTLNTSPLVYYTITASAQIPTYDSTTGLYYVEETVEAADTGTGYNVALNSIKQISPVISQASTAFNTETASIAADIETNGALIQRIKDAWAGREISTKTGLKIFAKSFSGVSDAYVADPADTLFSRASAGGADVYILGPNLASTSDSILYVAGVTLYLLQYQPAMSVTSVIGSISGAVTGFTITTDTGGYAKSARALNYLDLSGVTGLTSGELLTVTYIYDKNVYDIQAALQTDANKVVDSIILIKYGTIAYIDHTMTIETFSGVDPTSEINSLLSAYYDGGTYNGITYAGFILGESIQKSDVISLIQNQITDVDRIDLDTLVITKRGSGSTTDPIEVDGNEYARLGTLTITWS